MSSAAETAEPSAAPVGPEEAAAAFAALAAFRHVVLAVSGGPDSMALMALAARWRRGEPTAPAMTVATVDHGLRPESAAEGDLVEAEARRLGLPVRRLLWRAPRPRGGLQAAAREARYGLLAAAAVEIGAEAVVTAHQADDQAETVLARMVHGSGLAGLAGMRNARALPGGLALLRPCLGWPKSRLRATAGLLGMAWMEDPSNGDAAFERTRIRAALPRLEALGVTAERLRRLAVRAARADDALAVAAKAAAARHGAGGGAFSPGLWAEPDEIVLRVLQAELGGAVAVRLERLERLLDALRAASAGRKPLRRSVGDRLAVLDRAGRLTIAPAPPRRRGRAGAAAT